MQGLRLRVPASPLTERLLSKRWPRAANGCCLNLNLTGPKVILCVGAPSAKNIIKPNFFITKERGKFFPCELAKCCLATLHPAYILRQQSASNDGGYSLLVADIAKAWDAAQRLVEKANARAAEPPKALH